jgi:hypothetical protein
MEDAFEKGQTLCCSICNYEGQGPHCWEQAAGAKGCTCTLVLLRNKVVDQQSIFPFVCRQWLWGFQRLCTWSQDQHCQLNEPQVAAPGALPHWIHSNLQAGPGPRSTSSSQAPGQPLQLRLQRESGNVLRLEAQRLGTVHEVSPLV